MKIGLRNRMRAALAGAALALGAAGASSPVMAEDIAGQNEYVTWCSVCHGVDGKGDGPFGEVLKVKPADLTVLAKNNGGAFPLDRVFRTVEGSEPVPGHGDRMMPIWGDRFRADADSPFGPEAGEWAATARIVLVVYYLQNIQEE